MHDATSVYTCAPTDMYVLASGGKGFNMAIILNSLWNYPLKAVFSQVYIFWGESVSVLIPKL